MYRTLVRCRPSTSGLRFTSNDVPKTATAPAGVKVFNRDMKRRQRDWVARQPDRDDAQYVKEEAGWRIADKVFDLTKFNPLVLDIGCGLGHIAPHLIKENVGKMIQIDMSKEILDKSKGCEDEGVEIERLHCDEETLEGFHKDQFDLLLSSLSAHWINDLPGWFSHCFDILKPDCPFIGSILCENSLYELRCSLQLAELERTGGVGSHISPFVKAQDIGSLMNRAGFDMITLDTDEIEVGYPSMFALMYDLQLMGESHCTHNRSLGLRRDTLIAAQAIYKAMYGREEDRFPATFRIVSYIGWKPGPHMPKAAKRGSQNVSLKDLSKLMEDPDLIQKISDDSKKDK